MVLPAEERPEPWWRSEGEGKMGFVRLLLVGQWAAWRWVCLRKGIWGFYSIFQRPEIFRRSQEEIAKIPEFRLWYGVMAVVFAPFAEEYLFRGLLFRALDREWGGWKAVAGSAALFAIYHPALSWVPVALLGAANSILFKKTGRLAPAVVLHMVYNAVVLLQ